MALIPSYLSWAPKTGTGNASVTVNSAEPYLGRLDRTTEVTGKLVGKDNSVVVTVIEKAADEYITVEGQTVTVSKDGETITVSGRSNSKKLTFSWLSDAIGFGEVTSFTVNDSTAATSGVDIEGDPGAVGEFTFKATIVAPENKTIEARASVLKIAGEAADAQITFNQVLGDSYLYINTEGNTSVTLTIPQGGGEQTFEVLSNDTWTFEPTL